MVETAENTANMKQYEKNSYCSFCGNAFPINLAWPRRCPHCGNTSYLNPLPVSSTLR